MDFERRRLMLAAGATASAAVLPRRLLAADPVRTESLDAQNLAEPSAAGRLGYRKPPTIPMFRIPQDMAFRIRLKNELGEATGLDWHGLRGADLPDVIPGLVGAPLAPGAETIVAIKPSASGASWFHPPFVPGWADQTALGLGGILIVEEPMPPAVDDDTVLFITDRSGARGSGLQDRLTVNGKALPETKTMAPGSRIRLRLVNGSTRLALVATFQGAHPFVIAIDSQPSDLFSPRGDLLPVGPGARFDLLVDLPRSTGQDFRVLVQGVEEGSTLASLPILVLHAEGMLQPMRPPIAALAPNPALPKMIPLEKAKRVDLAVRRTGGAPKAASTYAINGTGSVVLSKTPLFAVKRGTAVTLGFSNMTADLIGFRLHGHVMRLLHSLDDGWEPYWRDSILVPPGKPLHAAFLADNPGRWLIDSPFFEQATNGLRHWFEIT